jgi:UDP-N-acetylmuramyl pentapeptide phosphotransferase/UDP-N-acetylglucosamine-1-phosphate transferase
MAWTQGFLVRVDWALPIASFLGALLLTRLLVGRRLGVPLDRPNARSLHVLATPRGGGLAIWAGWAIAWPWLEIELAWAVPLLALALVSFFDDRADIAIGWRLLVQLAACAGFVFYALRPVPPVWIAVDILALVWMLNLFNFMDGSDGLAAGMAVCGFALFAIAATYDGARDGALLFAALAAACLGFLVFNFPYPRPARIFLGDVGSIPLGFLAGAFGLWGTRRGYWPLAFTLLVFFPFIADASVTLTKRLLRGERVWLAHREHYYQRLVLLGWSHRVTALVYYLLMLSSGASALAALLLRPDLMWPLVLGWCVVYSLLYALVDRYWTRHAAKAVRHAH